MREELPEDVQAAIAAARAAVAQRTSPHGTPRAEVVAAQPPHASSASAAASRAMPESLDDAAGLKCPQRTISGSMEVDEVDELPQEESIVEVVVSAEPAQRHMPLQDVSNLPQVPAAGHTGKPASAAGQGGVGKTARTGSRCDASTDKENATVEAGRAEAPSNQKQPVLPQQNNAQDRKQQESIAGAAHSDADHSPPSPPKPRPSQASAASPPPATRLRMRFEARLREQAGRPHPLSVRTGPESPLPGSTLPPWAAAMRLSSGIEYGLQLQPPGGISLGLGMLPAHFTLPWSVALHSMLQAGLGFSARDGGMVHGGGAFAGPGLPSEQQQQQMAWGQAHQHPLSPQQHQPHPPPGSPRARGGALECDERIEWEVRGPVALCEGAGQRSNDQAPH